VSKKYFYDLNNYLIGINLTKERENKYVLVVLIEQTSMELPSWV
jgi:hypothetical protein